MKKNISYLLSLSLIAIIASGCLYEEGPIFSFNSPEYRIAYSWSFDKVELNGLNVLAGNNLDSINYGSSFVGFDKSGRFAFLTSDLRQQNKGVFVYTGDWYLIEGKTKLVMEYDNDVRPTKTYKITKLLESDFRFTNIDNNGNVSKYYLKPKTK